MEMSEVKNIVFGKICLFISIALATISIILSFYALKATGERNVLEQTVKTRDEMITRKNDQINFQNAWTERDKIDEVKKDEEYNRTMASKPKYKTRIGYVPTGDKCVDYDKIIDEARGSAL